MSMNKLWTIAHELKKYGGGGGTGSPASSSCLTI